jgi:hypothetical protein
MKKIVLVLLVLSAVAVAADNVFTTQSGLRYVVL